MANKLFTNVEKFKRRHLLATLTNRFCIQEEIKSVEIWRMLANSEVITVRLPHLLSPNVMINTEL
jgi:hypothetical protein